MTAPARQFVRAMPVLDCADMSRSLAFYKERLGFSATTFGEPASFAILQRGTVTLALSLRPADRLATGDTWAAYIYVADADAVHAELARHGLAAEAPCTRDYNCRDFTIEDPDGNQLGIGHVIEPDPLGPGLSDRLGRDGAGHA